MYNKKLPTDQTKQQGQHFRNEKPLLSQENRINIKASKKVFAPKPKHDHRKSNQSNEENDEIASFQYLQQQLLETSNLVVSEGEKNVHLTSALVAVRDELKIVRRENRELRETLLQGINNGVSQVNIRYTNIPLKELLRLCFQEHKVTHSQSHPKKYHHKQPMKQKPTKDINTTHTNILRNSKKETEQLNEKLIKTLNASKREREMRMKLDRDLQKVNDKVSALSEHIEKLMVHLKFEVTSKAKALKKYSRCLKERDSLAQRCSFYETSSNGKEDAIAALKDNSNILEKQLIMMNDKYIELRKKLDWTRTNMERVIKKKDDEINNLRTATMQMNKELAESKISKKRLDCKRSI